MTTTSATFATTVSGYPRQGARRELKKTTEAYWSQRIGAGELLDRTRTLRRQRWTELAEAGIDELPSNDFSLYDHVLDTVQVVGAVPARHAGIEDRLDRYFAMARGTADAEPLEMTKWFDTNYHYLVPELSPRTRFALDAEKPLGEFAEALELGHRTRPVILGPVSFLLLSKPDRSAPADFRPLDLLDAVLPVYRELLQQLHQAGAAWVQFDEPCLVTDQPDAVLAEVDRAYRALSSGDRPRLIIGSYFDRLGSALPVLAGLPVEGLAIDLTGAAAANPDDLVALGGLPGKRLIAGVVDGRNVWATDLSAALSKLEQLAGLVGEDGRLDVAPSCSLLHVPLDVDLETGLSVETRSWLAFAAQKLTGLTILQRGLVDGRSAIGAELRRDADRRRSRADSDSVRVTAVRERLASIADEDRRRRSSYPDRRSRQHDRLRLPLLPTTTIGSFPQTSALRRSRADLRRGRISADDYRAAIRSEVDSVITEQEQLGLDVLVHGEPERNDMVQYFAEQLDGFLATEHGWVQSYGSRYVRPPIIAGDVSRPAPMTVGWTRYAQDRTKRPVKGMLTGPVTMLAWSFVRDDQPLAETARQVALALRDEVADLEAAGIGIIQVDEPALRETLPLRHSDRADYLRWAVDSFRLATAGVADDVQIHTHMCYAEFGDVMEAIIAMDADVISLEAARSKMAIVADLASADYPNEVGPGVWDIHSPRVPPVEEVADQLRTAAAVFGDRLWANPDCGLKTRGYPETRAALANLVTAARTVRAETTEAASPS